MRVWKSYKKRDLYLKQRKRNPRRRKRRSKRPRRRKKLSSQQIYSMSLKKSILMNLKRGSSSY